MSLEENKALLELSTPALLLDSDVLERNCTAMAARATRLGVQLRPHLKTSKSVDVARLATNGHFGGVTVSTVAEVEYFASHGFKDITYAVGITVNKIEALDRIQRERGATVTVIADQVSTVQAAARQAAALGARFPMLIEIDTGGGRGGVDAEGAELAAIAEAIQGSGVFTLKGVLTHAGHSYHVEGRDAISAIAENERAGAVKAAERLRGLGFQVDVVSVGSTPTALCAQSLEGVTEMRPGVYTLFDLDQVARGLCAYEDIAVSVLATVIGHNPRSGRVLIDAGALALSKDTSGAEFRSDLGYGLICPVQGSDPLPGLCVGELHQEHGLIATTGDSAAMFEALPIGSRVRILPHHACMTAAPFDAYHVVRTGASSTHAVWGKTRGWRAAH